MAKVYATPGVYIEEKSAFPNSAVPVATAVPAFIGYTEKAIFNKKDLTLKPTKLSSFGEYLLYFGGGPKTTYDVENIRKRDPNRIYEISPKNDRFFLFNCMKMFFANGGSDCYIISVGNYSDAINKDRMVEGIQTLLKEPEPTMLVIPDAVLLEKNDCYSLQQQMLIHCGMEMRNRVSILDVFDGFKKKTPDEDVINDFREGIGGNFLQWGAAYYPWVDSTIIAADEVDFTNIDSSAMGTFMSTLKQEVALDVKAGITKQERANLINAEIDGMPKAGLHAGVPKLFEGLSKFAKELSEIEAEDFTEAGTALTGATAEEGEELSDALKRVFADTRLGSKSKSLFTPTLEALQALAAFETEGDNSKIPAATDPLAQEATAAELATIATNLGELKEMLEEGEIASAAMVVARHFGNVDAAGKAVAALEGAPAEEEGADPAAVTPEAILAKIQEIMVIDDAAKGLEDILGDIRAEIEALKQSFADDDTIQDVLALIPFNPFADAATNGTAVGEVDAERLQDKANQAIKDRKNPKTLHQTLLAISPLYKAILGSVREHMNLLPPSSGMAGIYSMVDNSIGVWQSPANVSFGSVVKPSVNLTNDEQEDLNVPLNGKAVNAIRTFPGKGPLVWGARTLDGNSLDWRYVSVRRTVIFLEQSIKYAAEAYVFQPNTAITWTNIKALITNFLTNTWQQGALAGATAEDAFSVDVGLGTTMTPVDILEGIMRITVKIAVTRPAEFIVITFQQKMQQS